MGAKLAKKLLEMFIAAQLRCREMGRKITSRDYASTLRRANTTSSGDALTNAQGVTITRDLFLLVVQDQDVQKVMNEMDIPPDRASLFDVFDADGDGRVDLLELMTGMLRIRGELRRSDVIGSLLGVRSLQTMVTSLTERTKNHQARLEKFLNDHRENLDASPDARMQPKEHTGFRVNTVQRTGGDWTM